MSMHDLMKQLSMEADDLATEESGELTDVFDELSGEEPRETATDMVAHADKAQFVADQLDELADKAEEVAQEDKEYMLNDVSTEAMAMVYRNIMASNGLDLRATSFEANYDHLGKMRGLAQDARASAQQMHGLHDSILNFSPEGKFNRWIGKDRRVINSAFAEMKKNRAKAGNLKALEEKPVVINSRAFGKFLTRSDGSISDIGKEIKKDVDLMISTHKQLETGLEKLLSDLKSGKDLTSDYFGTFDVIGKPLMGLRSFTAEEYDYDENKFMIGLKSIPGTLLRFIGWRIVYGLTVGVAGMVIPGLWVITSTAAVGYGSLALTAVVAAKTTIENNLDKSQGVAGAANMDEAYNSMEQLRVIFDRSSIEKSFASIKEISKGSENARVVDGIIKSAMVIHEGIYEHSMYLVESTSRLSVKLNS